MSIGRTKGFTLIELLVAISIIFRLDIVKMCKKW